MLSIDVSSAPDSNIGIVCGAPRAGTCVAGTPVRRRNNSPARCGVVPTPDEPKVMPLGCALPQAMNSLSVLDGCCGATITMLQLAQKVEASTKPRSGSYGRLLNKYWLMVRVPMVALVSV